MFQNKSKTEFENYFEKYFKLWKKSVGNGMQKYLVFY